MAALSEIRRKGSGTQALCYTCTKTHSYLPARLGSGNDGTIHSKVHTYWTQKGRLFLYGLLKGQGIYPLIERHQSAADDFAEVDT